MDHFLNPENYPPTPLVELPPDFLGSLYQGGIRAFAKCEYLGPLMNIKARQVSGIMRNAYDRGDLFRVQIVDENSSGSTAHLLPIYARMYGIPCVQVLTPKLGRGKSRMIRLTGGTITECEEGGIAKAREQGSQGGHFNPNQYGNPANPRAMEALAAEIWDQTNGELSLIVAGTGTTATLTGVWNFLREKKSKVKTVAVLLSPKEKTPGLRPEARLQDDFEWRKKRDYEVEVKGAAKLMAGGRDFLVSCFNASNFEGKDARFVVDDRYLEAVYQLFESRDPNVYEIGAEREIGEELTTKELPIQNSPIFTATELAQVQIRYVTTMRQKFSTGPGTSARGSEKLPTMPRRRCVFFQMRKSPVPMVEPVGAKPSMMVLP